MHFNGLNMEVFPQLAGLTNISFQNVPLSCPRLSLTLLVLKFMSMLFHQTKTSIAPSNKHLLQWATHCYLSASITFSIRRVFLPSIYDSASFISQALLVSSFKSFSECKKTNSFPSSVLDSVIANSSVYVLISWCQIKLGTSELLDASSLVVLQVLCPVLWIFFFTTRSVCCNSMVGHW